jgi:hypothetical protein
VPRLVPDDDHQPCSHGLGHLLNPTDPDSEDRDWIRQFWEHHLTQQLTDEPPPQLRWLDHPALGKISITSPATWRQLGHYNNGKPYRDQIKPFGFLLHAPGADLPDMASERGRLVAPYTKQPGQWLRLDWIDVNNPDHAVKITTDPTGADRALVDTYGAIADTYFTHREAKAADSSGAPAGRASRGLLQRRHVHASGVTIIGKEANDLDDRAAGVAPDLSAEPSLTVYRQRAGAALDPADLARLSNIGPTRLATLTGLSSRRIADILHGKATPRTATRLKLAYALEVERAHRMESRPAPASAKL